MEIHYLTVLLSKGITLLHRYYDCLRLLIDLCLCSGFPCFQLPLSTLIGGINVFFTLRSSLCVLRDLCVFLLFQTSVLPPEAGFNVPPLYSRHGRERPWHTDFTYCHCCLKNDLPYLPKSSMLEFFKATISFNLPQFVSAAAKGRFANVITIPAFTTGGQHGVMAQDRRRGRLERKRTPSSKNLYLILLLVLGTPSSRSSLFLFTNCIGVIFSTYHSMNNQLFTLYHTFRTI